MEKKSNIIQRISHAFYDVNYYQTFLKESVGKALWMIVLVTILMGLISSSLSVALFSNEIEDSLNSAVHELPYFKLANGKLIANDETLRVFGDNNNYVVFDLQQELGDIEFIKKYNNGLYLTEDYILMVNRGELQKLNFTDLQGLHFDRNDLQNLVSPFMIVIKVIFMLLPFIQGIGKMINLLLIALLCIIIGLGFKRRSSYSEAFRVACYANVVPTVVVGLLGIVPFANLSLGWSFSIIYYGGTMIYAALIYQAMQKNPPTDSSQFKEIEE